MAAKRDTYKYQFKIGNLIVHKGATNNLQRRENEHKNSGRYVVHNGKRLYWKDGHIHQVGAITTKEAATKWARE